MAKNRLVKTGSGDDHIARLRRYGVPFIIQETNNTTRIETDDEVRIYTDNAVPMKDLSFIGRVKANARSLDPEAHPEKPYSSRDVRYWRFNTVAQKEYLNLTEIDVNGAYWEIAFKFGYLTEELYQEGLIVDKMTRLIALGALATKYQYWKYDGGNEPPAMMEVEEDDTDRRVRSYFFHVAAHLGKIMESVTNTYNGVLWYWVDAFFVDREDAARIPEALAAHGLKIKEKKIERVVVEEVFHDDGTPRGLALCCYMEGEFGYKPFFLHNDKAKQQRRAKALKLAIEAPPAP